MFTVIVDDLVFADGSTRMGVLGGGGPQTAFGFRTHPGNFSVGLAARIGPDFPRECEDWLDANGVDSEGLMLVRDDDTDTCGAAEREGGGGEASASAAARAPRTEEARRKEGRPDARTFRPTPRAWQITAARRPAPSWRTPANAGLYAMLRPPVETLPPRYRGARAFHVGVNPERPDAALLASLQRILGGGDARLGASKAHRWLSVEPFTHATRPVPRETLEALCSAGNVFSPNELEAVSLVGEGLRGPELCRRPRAAGAKIVCVRRGAKGADRARRRDGRDVARACFFSEDQSGALADVTGCGNAFCGGFIAGLAAASRWTAPRAGARRRLAVAEHVGVPAAPAGDAETREEVRRRFEALLRRTEKIVGDT